MVREIVLTRPVRVFRRAHSHSPTLRQTQSVLVVGATVQIGEICSMTYDHRDQDAFPLEDGSGFILQEEAQIQLTP